MTGYYRQCIAHYARLAEPLQNSFETIEKALCSKEVMVYLQLDKPYKLYTDACDHAVGGILVQDDANDIGRVVQYVSHQLSGSQLHWATIEKEAYVVVSCLGKLHPYLCGASFTIYTDHRPLKSRFTALMKNTKIQKCGTFHCGACQDTKW